jgi:tetratricopeptide (TPR) repeat protein
MVDPRYRTQWTANNYNNLGLAYEYLGNLYMAQSNYLMAANNNPTLDLAWYNLALVAARRNETSTVASSLIRLRTINPHLELESEKLVREQKL